MLTQEITVGAGVEIHPFGEFTQPVTILSVQIRCDSVPVGTRITVVQSINGQDWFPIKKGCGAAEQVLERITVDADDKGLFQTDLFSPQSCALEVESTGGGTIIAWAQSP